MIENINDNGYISLQEAIVEQAFRDYLYCMEEMSNGYAHEKTRELYREGLVFFQSDWYRWLTDIDAERVMKKIKRIIRTRMKQKRIRYWEKPVCVKDCFAQEGDRCEILIDNHFKDDLCPFYKRHENDIAGRRDGNR